MATIRRDCPHCPASHVAFEIKWAEQFHGMASTWNCVAICGACSNPVCFVARNRDGTAISPLQYQGQIEKYWQVDKIWPTMADPSAPLHTPLSVKKRFLEGEDAFSRGNWNSAIAMYRAALGIATKAMKDVPGNKNFYERLQWLHKENRITEDIRSWADHVRVEGNNVLHDPEDFEEDDARPLRLFTEMFLRYVFELPGEVRAFRGEAGIEP